MNNRTYRSSQGKRGGNLLLLLGTLVLVASVLMYFAAPFSVRKFAAFPAIGGVFLLLFGLTAYCSQGTGKIMRRVLAGLVVLGLAGFGALEGIVIAGARDDIQGKPEVVVVLGAQVHPWGPSVLLADRLDTAYAYLVAHPELKVVVTGGQGPDEPTTEAAAMRDYLVDKGLDSARIWLEEESHNTTQNLIYTSALLEEKGLDVDSTHILVVSNGFHLARVRMLAHRHGMEISTLAAPESHAAAKFQSYIREAPALVKSWIFDW